MLDRNAFAFKHFPYAPSTINDRCWIVKHSKLQQECLGEDRRGMTLEERGKQITLWLNDYRFYRPHQALNYLTPSEYCATLELTILRQQVSTM
ncbi:MAG TPA: integrase core domain-containing protein [Candidatus Dormibacteraeota bacterium]|nr:integrase core domain-containing protein [Candidatus Dormibacteraeota bacterium]